MTQDPHPQMEDFGPWLGRQLRRKGMSQSELAAALDVTRAAVSAWITGRATPRIDKIQAIDELLGLASGSSMTREETPDSAGSIDWHLRPAHEDGGRELGNAAAFAFDSNLAVLAREATQNSLDERFDETRAVRVRFILNELTGERLRGFQEAIRWDTIAPHIKAAADPAQKVGRVLADGLRELHEGGSLLLLRVDDYNANGLTDSEYDDGRFAAVIRRQMDSHKGDQAGGSYGLGKATLWATSRFGLVIVNSTLSAPYEGRRDRRVIGRIDLPWHKRDDKGYAGPAWLGERDPRRNGAARSWWAGERTVEELRLSRSNADPGTSFLIVGAYDPSGEATTLQEMHAALVKSLADGFWASMVSGRGKEPVLEASVEARRNDKEIVVPEERVDPHRYQRARSRAVRAYKNGETVDSLTSADDVVAARVPLLVPPRKTTGQTQPVEHSAVLLVTPAGDDEERPNRVAGMRGTLMTVSDRAVGDLPLGAPRFQAVLLAGHATGINDPDGEPKLDATLAEEFLRAAEPPEHNDWKPTEDLTATFARGAVSRLKEFRSAVLAAVRDTVRPADGGPADREVPEALQGLVKLDPPKPVKSPGYPTVRSASGEVDDEGAWRIRVEVRLPQREDPWVIRPLLRFSTRSGPRPEVPWARLEPLEECEVVDGSDLRCRSGARRVVFIGVSDITGHPVNARMSTVEVDLMRVRGGA